MILIESTSCNRYIDKTVHEKDIKVAEGNMNMYPDKNTFIYKSNIALRADMQVFRPKTFTTDLPKGLRWFDISNSESFTFFYNKSQVIAININLTDTTTISDTTYVPGRVDIERFIAAFPSGTNTRYNLKNIESISGRKHLLIRKNAATILLYNILPNKYDIDSACLMRFKFL